MGRLNMNLYLKSLKKRYFQTNRKGNTLILDEFCAITGLTRKHAISIFNGSSSSMKGCASEKKEILRFDVSDKGGKLEFNERPNVKPETIIKLIQKEAHLYRLEGPTRLRFSLAAHELNERIALVDALLDRLST